MAATDPYGLKNSGFMSAENYYPEEAVNRAVSMSTYVIQGLDQQTREMAIELYRDMFYLGYLLYMFSGYRSFDKQLALYEQYKQGTGNIAAPPGDSMHNYGRAIDLMVLDFSGEGQLPGGLKKVNQANENLNIPFKWGGSFNDPNHYWNDTVPVSELKKNSIEYVEWLEETGWQPDIVLDDGPKLSGLALFWNEQKEVAITMVIGLAVLIMIFIASIYND